MCDKKKFKARATTCLFYNYMYSNMWYNFITIIYLAYSEHHQMVIDRGSNLAILTFMCREYVTEFLPVVGDAVEQACFCYSV